MRAANHRALPSSATSSPERERFAGVWRLVRRVHGGDAAASVSDAALLDELGVGAFVIDRQGRIERTNRSFDELVGMEAGHDASTGTDLAELFVDRPVVRQTFELLLTTGQPQDFEARIRASGGQDFWVRCGLAAADTASQSQIDGYLVDITGRKQAAEAAARRAAVSGRIALLSAREREVFDLVVSGMANKVIAREMGISEKTVEKHRSNMMRKLQMDHVADLVRLAVVVERHPAPHSPRTSATQLASP